MQHDLLLHALVNYFADDKRIDRVVDIIEGRSEVSLRLLDWFATNYSKKTNIILRTQQGCHFNIYMDYRAQLRAFSKQFFDPFRRKEKFTFHYANNKSVLTTIGQLNFFRWILANGILDYILHGENLRIIEEDMLRCHRDIRHATEHGIVRKRIELSKNMTTRAMTKHLGPAVLSFT